MIKPLHLLLCKIRTFLPFFIYAYDLRDVFTRYAMAVGSSEYPSSIVVEYVVNPNGLDLEKAETKTVVVERKSIVETTTD